MDKTERKKTNKTEKRTKQTNKTTSYLLTWRKSSKRTKQTNQNKNGTNRRKTGNNWKFTKNGQNWQKTKQTKQKIKRQNKTDSKLTDTARVTASLQTRQVDRHRKFTDTVCLKNMTIQNKSNQNK